MERVKFKIEFIFKASPTILYQFLTTPSCLIRWFCDKADIQGDFYTFWWGNSEEVAVVIDDIEEERLRLKWLEAEEGEYLEFAISTSPITGETIMYITDFCDEDEVEDQKQLWVIQIQQLQKECGG
ncbi:MAG: activator of HSP90 ATPase 1 family protein [Saprospiraceae bacterium]|nr:activator of HSP90 ATPase 1 family protein [Saprospiraceae bacterium]